MSFTFGGVGLALQVMTHKSMSDSQIRIRKWTLQIGLYGVRSCASCKNADDGMFGFYLPAVKLKKTTPLHEFKRE